jgi:hypothetical protein
MNRDLRTLRNAHFLNIERSLLLIIKMMEDCRILREECGCKQQKRGQSAHETPPERLDILISGGYRRVYHLLKSPLKVLNAFLTGVSEWLRFTSL